MAEPATIRAEPTVRSDEGLSDETLVARVQKGDRTAFAMLVERHLDRTVAVAQRILLRRAEAEDVAQDVFLKLWQSLDHFDATKARFSTWLYRVTINRALDVARRKAPASLPDLMDAGFDVVDEAPSALEAVQHQDRLKLLAAGMASLPERQRAALALSYHRELSDREAAVALAVSVKAYEALLVRARRSLRTWMQAKGGQNDE